MKNPRTKYFIFFGFFILLFALWADVVSAQVGLNPDYAPPNIPKLQENSADAIRLALTYRIVRVLLGVAGTAAVFFIVNSGFSLISSGGNEEKITTNKKALMWAVIGLVLVILSYAIIRFVLELPFNTVEGS